MYFLFYHIFFFFIRYDIRPIILIYEIKKNNWRKFLYCPVLRVVMLHGCGWLVPGGGSLSKHNSLLHKYCQLGHNSCFIPTLNIANITPATIRYTSLWGNSFSLHHGVMYLMPWILVWQPCGTSNQVHQICLTSGSLMWILELENEPPRGLKTQVPSRSLLHDWETSNFAEDRLQL